MSFHFVIVKLLRALLTIGIVVTFTFFILMVSGDPIDALVGDDAPVEVTEYYTQKYGLDRPLYAQFVSYVGAVLTGDFGISFSDETPAIDAVLEAIPKTIQLGLTAFAFVLLISIPLGMLAALYRNRAIDRFAMSFAVFGFSIPNFFLGILLILIFSLTLRVLPSSGSDTLWHMILPVITLATHEAGGIVRFTRSSMLEVLNKSYMRTAKAKGVPRGPRIRWHALPNAAIPIVTILGLRLGGLLGGSIVVETVFAWPGIGRLLVNSVASRELAIVQAILILTAAAIIVINLLIDLLYGWIDPRVRTGDKD